jgi:hypothetical protein
VIGQPTGNSINVVQHSIRWFVTGLDWFKRTVLDSLHHLVASLDTAVTAPYNLDQEYRPCKPIPVNHASQQFFREPILYHPLNHTPQQTGTQIFT